MHYKVFFKFSCSVNSQSCCLDSVLKAFHTKGILTGEECSDCASKGFKWYQVTAVVVATKPSNVQQMLDVVREQSAFDEQWTLKELRGILKGRQYSYRCVTRTAHGAKVGACSDMVCQEIFGPP